jgi:prepilin-type N-terminal cleavage/methylation domain-containing protein
VIRSRPRRPAGDDGFSLTEVIVSMTVMSVVTALFTTAIIEIYSNTNSNESLTLTTQQIHNAFIRLDRGIRYSSGISDTSTGGKAGGPWVEYALTNTDTTICTQLHLSTDGRLETRTKTGTQPATAWTTLASNLDATASSLVRTLGDANKNPYQQLAVNLTATAGSGTTKKRDTVSFTYTALNTTPDTDSDAICATLDRP